MVFYTKAMIHSSVKLGLTMKKKNNSARIDKAR